MKVLVVVDMQNDFIDGALSNTDAQAIVKDIAQLVSSWQGLIVFTRDTHDSHYLNTQEGKYLPVPHCIKDTNGWQINQQIFDSANNNVNAQIVVVDKPTFGAGNLLYDAITKYCVPQEIVFCGTCTDICVVSNVLAIKALLPETPVKVLAHYCAGVTKQKHNAALEVMQSCQAQIIDGKVV